MSETQSTKTLLFPQKPSNEELARGWTLSPSDQEETFRCRGGMNRLRFALQLCTLRTYGQFLHEYSAVPVVIMNHLAHQLGLSPLLSLSEPDRPATETLYRQRIRDYLSKYK